MRNPIQVAQAVVIEDGLLDNKAQLRYSTSGGNRITDKRAADAPTGDGDNV
jgi:hypothetical protein